MTCPPPFVFFSSKSKTSFEHHFYLTSISNFGVPVFAFNKSFRPRFRFFLRHHTTSVMRKKVNPRSGRGSRLAPLVGLLLFF